MMTMLIGRGLAMWATTIALCTMTQVAVAQEVKDRPGGKDSEYVSRFAGSVLVNYGQQQFEQINAPLGLVQWDGLVLKGDKMLKAEGRLSHYLYWAPAERTSLEVYRSYEAALKSKGFTIVFACEQPQQCQSMGLQHYAAQWTGAGSTFQGGYRSLSTMDDNGNYPPRYLVAKREAPDGDVYVTLTAREPSTTEKGKKMGGPYYLQVLEVQKMKSDSVQVFDAKAMGSALEQAGKVVIYGIEFDTDSASIRPASQPQLQQMATVLKGQPQLKVFIVGHTDNAGGYEHNRGLSQRRAQSVVEALSNQGVDKARLQAVGVANVVPMASNANEAGRAKNRRVEMVLQ
jgi:outer membrane protein OmpA-like peptidoglycan-associated protein